MFEKVFEVLGHDMSTLANVVFQSENEHDRVSIGKYYYECSDEERKSINKYPVGNLVIEDEKLIAEYMSRMGEYFKLRDDMKQMAQEMEDQLAGKSVAAACKAWPEVADIICKEMAVEHSGGYIAAMTTPLSVLLGKYLPALPAPAAKEEVAA
jgi:hypothetical protein